MKYRLECHLYNRAVDGASVIEKFASTNNAITMCEIIKKLKERDDVIYAKLFYDKTTQEILSMDSLGNVNLNHHIKFANCFRQLGGI